MELARLVKEIFFPRWCCGCNWYGELLCVKCFSQLEFGNEIISGTYLDSLSSLVSLEPISRSLIHQLKYQSVKEIAVLCARMMFMYGDVPQVDIITNIPLHPFRKFQRGFNQAEEIGIEFARLNKQPYVPLLKRVKHVTNLAKITELEKRKKIINNQFELNLQKTEPIKNKSILIIDDVWTTGATLEEAAKVLKMAGVKKVYGYSFAHGL